MALFPSPTVRQPEEQNQALQSQQQFQPKWDDKTVRKLVDSYKKNP